MNLPVGGPGRTVISKTANPWGAVPVTAGGKSLTDRARAYLDELHRRGRERDCESRRHHYVPRAICGLGVPTVSA
jgi:hypothetical protein